MPFIRHLLLFIIFSLSSVYASAKTSFPFSFGHSLDETERSYLLKHDSIVNNAMVNIAFINITEGKILLDSLRSSPYREYIDNDTCIVYLQLRHYHVLGMYQKEIGLLKSAASTFQKIIASIPANFVTVEEFDDFRDIAVYFLSDIDLTNGRYDKAINLMLQSESDRIQDRFYLSNLAGLYQKSKKHELAEVYFNKLEERLDAKKSISDIRKMKESLRNTYISYYHKLVEFYRSQEKYSKALEIIEQSQKYILKDNLNSLRKSYKQKGVTFFEMRKFQLALENFTKSLEVTKQFYLSIAKHYQYSSLEKQLANTYSKLEKPDSALHHYQLALITLVNSFNTIDLNKNPHLDSTEYKKQLLEILGKKAQCLNTRKKTGDLGIAFRTSTLAINLIDSIRLGYTEDFDKQFLLQQSYSIFETAIDVAYQLEDYGQAFEWSEKSKALLLYEAVKNSFAEEYGAIEPEDLEKERLLKYDLNKLTASLRKSSNPEKTQSLRTQRFKAKQKLQELINTFENKYPQYHQLKYQLDVVTPKTIAKSLLAKGQSLVEYFVGEKSIYIFLIEQGDEQVQVFRLNKDKNFNHWAGTIRDDIYKEDTIAYTEKAYTLYKQLFAPFKERTNKRLIIIPDGIMGYIPFNALLMDSLGLDEQDDFRDFPFMTKSFQLSQCFSASILAQMKVEDKRIRDKKIMAWAPEFREAPIQLNREKLSPLPYAPQEVDSIKAIWGNANTLQGPLATKAAFVKAIDSKQTPFQILHIASHAIVNDKEPNYSFIAFSNIDSQKDEDYKLYVSELYNQQLDFDMVVLSACKTGDGKLFKGEGIISISRAFTYAGAKSILTSLWNINDKLSSRLMEGFYNALKKGQSKDEALQTAQIQMLESRLLANPKYWAAFVPIGDMTPLTENRHTSMWGGVIGGIIGVLLMFFFFRRRRQR